MSGNLNRAANLATILVAACALIATVSVVRARRVGPGAVTRSLPDTVTIEDWRALTIGGHAYGPDSAPITILEFGDYECPYCAKFAREMENALRAYPGKLRLIYRHWPLPMHRFAYPAARAAECAAKQGHFWEYHRLLYAKADSLGLITFSDFASRSGIRDLSAFESCIADSQILPILERAKRDVESIGGTGTPTVIINGILTRRIVDSAYVASALASLAQHR